MFGANMVSLCLLIMKLYINPENLENEKLPDKK